MTHEAKNHDSSAELNLATRPSMRVPVLIAVISISVLAIVVVYTYNVPGFEVLYQLTLVAGVIFFGRSYLNCILTRYTATPLQLTVERGILVRTRRAIPLNRITNFELILPLHKSILGLADLHVDTAGGSGVELRMDGLLREHAEDFKRYISVQIGEQKVSDAGDGTDLQERRMAAVEEIKDHEQ